MADCVGVVTAGCREACAPSRDGGDATGFAIAAAQPATLPPAIWRRIARHSDPSGRQALALVSHRAQDALKPQLQWDLLSRKLRDVWPDLAQPQTGPALRHLLTDHVAALPASMRIAPLRTIMHGMGHLHDTEQAATAGCLLTALLALPDADRAQGLEDFVDIVAGAGFSAHRSLSVRAALPVLHRLIGALPDLPRDLQFGMAFRLFFAHRRSDLPPEDRCALARLCLRLSDSLHGRRKSVVLVWALQDLQHLPDAEIEPAITQAFTTARRIKPQDRIDVLIELGFISRLAAANPRNPVLNECLDATRPKLLDLMAATLRDPAVRADGRYASLAEFHHKIGTAN